MRCIVVKHEDRLFRYSNERHNSGRPVVLQFLNKQKVWRDVRNVDRSDWLWRVADENSLPALWIDEVCKR